MLGALYPRAGLSLFLFYLILAGALLRPQPQRSQPSDPEDFSAPLELLQPLSDLVDDYGIRPKHPWPRGPRPLLSQAQQRKRDGSNMADYYYDVNL